MSFTPKNSYAEACASALARDVLPQIATYIKANAAEATTLDLDALIAKFQQVLELPASRPSPMPYSNGLSHVPTMLPPPTIPQMGALTPALSGGALPMPNGLGALPATGTKARAARGTAKAPTLDQWSDFSDAKRRLIDGQERICSYMAPREPNKDKVCCVACPQSTATDPAKIRCKAHEKSAGKFEKKLADAGGSSVVGATPATFPGFNAPSSSSSWAAQPYPSGVPTMMAPPPTTSCRTLTAKAIEGMKPEHVCLTGDGIDAQLSQWVIDATTSGDNGLVVVGKFSFLVDDSTVLSPGYESSIVALSEHDISRLSEVQAKYVPLSASVPTLQTLGTSLPGIQADPVLPLMTMLPNVPTLPLGIPSIPRVPGIPTLNY